MKLFQRDMGIATKLLFVVPQSLQMRYPGIGPLSLEAQLRVPHQTGNFLIIGTCYVSANTKMAGWIEAGNFLMMHFRRFHSFSSAPKGEGAMRAAALRNLLEKFIFGKSKYCIPIWKEAVRINARNFPELSYDAFPEVLQL